MKKIELLSPAKNLETAICAVDYGADAIYIGANSFGARVNASNSVDDIAKVVEYAHKFNVKVYVTINTILNNDEIIEAQKLINDLYKIKVDAIIFQDMGLLELDLPPIKLFASTQCHNISCEKIKFLEQCGISRIILARELSLEQIENICKNTNCEIETFVHGALCVSYSGQCYFSAYNGNRSANRGNCAQVCRKKYNLLNSKGEILKKDKHLLSLKDFNASEYLEKLINAGVTSFKIEGRLKDESYIKNVVAFYRQKLDKIIQKEYRTSYGEINFDFTPDINKTFNRGYCTYFLCGKRDKISNFDSPKSIGEKIGIVQSVNKNYFILDENSLNNGDGICFYDENKNLVGTNINKVIDNKIYPNNIDNIKKGTTIYRNYDINFEKTLKNSHTKRKIPCNITVECDDDNYIMTIKDRYFSYQMIVKNEFELAKKQHEAQDTIIKQFLKSGESEFIVDYVFVNLFEFPFIPVSKLNEIRRRLFDEFSKYRLQNYKYETKEISKTNHPYLSKNITYKENVFNDFAKKFYKRHGAQNIETAFESCKQQNHKYELMRTKHCILNALNLCKKQTKTDDTYFLIDDKNKRYELEFDCKNCEMVILNMD